MLALLTLMPEWLSPETLIEMFGEYALYGVLAIIFAECGLLIGVVLPGDSMLFAFGMLTATGVITQSIWISIPLLIIAAILGNLVGYWLGAKVGPRLFTQDSRFFKQEYVDRTSEFFERYGNRAIVLARFVPIVRTVITALAGIGGMERRRYFTYTAIGAFVWAGGATLAGYLLGNIPIIKDNFELTLIAIVAISFIPIVIEYLRAKRES